MSHDLVVKGIMEELSKLTKKSDIDKSEMVKKVEKVWGLIWDVAKEKIKEPVAPKLTAAFIDGRTIICLKMLAQIRANGEFSLDDAKSNLARIYSALLRALTDGTKIKQNDTWPICASWLEEKGTLLALDELKSKGFTQKKEEQMEKSQTVLSIQYFITIMSAITDKGGKFKNDQKIQLLSGSYFEAFIPYVQSGFVFNFVIYQNITQIF